ncbi:MAG TPA: hypothetical protein PKN75_03980 [Bacteroidia bacterium]|nr:hypothetical protein [Bacteroidia bacterium]HNU32729.1 hypothetical protein [Bacteroidia bacterium]
MKNLNAVLSLIIVSSLVFCGCKKDSNDDNNNNNTTETCSDGIKNQDETDIDCGGVCPACPSPSFSMTVNGTAWAADSMYIDTTLNSGSVVTRLYGMQLSPLGTMQFLFTGSIPLNTNINLQSPPLGLIIGQKQYITLTNNYINCTSGTINFTRMDFTNKKASGTFNNITLGVSGSSQTVSLTSGSFVNIPIR